MKLKNILIVVKDIEKSRKFYHDLFGLDLVLDRGMTFVDSVIIYSYLQAIGVIYSHDKDCYLYKSSE